MGTEILRPQDCLIERIRLPPPSSSFPRRNSSYHYDVPDLNLTIPMKQQQHHHASNYVSTHRSARKPAAISRRSCRGANSDDLRGLKAEKVTILKLGEPLSKMKKAKSYCGLARMDNSKNIMYAGSAFAVSPEPSALPLPSFQRKKKQPSRSVDDSATRDLRRLLGLE